MNLMVCCARLLFMGVMGLFISAPAWAHKGSDAYLDVQQLHFSVSVALKDWDQTVAVDANADGRITWREVKTATPQMLALLNEHAQLQSPASAPTNTPSHCRLDWQFDGLEQRSDGAYLRATARPQCPADVPLTLRYTLFKAQDATHRLLVAGQFDGHALLSTLSPQSNTGWVLRSAASASAVTSPPASGKWQTLLDYAGLGLHHLLEGYDHLAFLLALVLPLRLDLRQALRAGFQRLRRPAKPINPMAQTSPGVWAALLRTVTAFTLGHSITLMLATLGWTQASPLWVEPVIAASIAVTALLNIRPVRWVRTDVLALLFGLVHGYGFAGLLQEAAAPAGLLAWALAGFNAGIEVGQLTAVFAWMLLAQVFIAQPWYARGVVRGGSVVLIILALYWFFQRVSL